MAGARLLRRDRGVRHQVGRGPDDPGQPGVEDDPAVHLGELPQPRRRELHVHRESAGAQRLDPAVVTQHDQRTGVAPEDALQAVPQRGARCHRGEGGAQVVAIGPIVRCHRLLAARAVSERSRVYPPVLARRRCCYVTIASASRRWATGTTVIPSGTGPGSGGTRAVVNPSRAASASRRPSAVTGRSSPASPTSPTATRPGGSGRSATVLATARAAARSPAGSAIRPPPTVATNTSLRVNGAPARRSRTASSMTVRAVSPPLLALRGTAAVAPETRAWTSVTSGRVPSTVTVTHEPGTGRACRDRNSPLGSATSAIPSSRSSKHPTSSAGPKRFFPARTMRSRPCRSPSKCRTTSTRCSSTRGPPIAPSFVTCPTRTVAIPRSLGDRDEGGRDLAHLRDAARRPLDVRRGDGLDRVDDEQARAHRVDVDEQRGQVGLRRQVEVRVEGTHAVGAQPDLRGRLLTGDDEAGVCRRGAPRGDLQQQRRLAGARFAREQHDRPGDEAAAEDAVELGDAGWPGPRRGRVDLADRARRPAHRPPGDAP